VSRPEVRPFADEHLAAAAELLAARHRHARAAAPMLSPRYERRGAARAELEAAWRVEGAAGAVALRGGRLLAYLVGAPGDEAAWGPNVWVGPAGHASEEAEVVRDLYALAAERWVDAGRTRHYALVPAGDASLLDAWARLCFGQQHAHAAREVPATPWPQGVRHADERDVDAVAALFPVLVRHQARAPVFSGKSPPEDVDELRAEAREDIAAGDVAILVAEAGGRVVGVAEVVPVERSSAHSGLARPDDACLLSFAATSPDVRGSGAGLALTDAALAWAHDGGYRTIVTDWRVTNLLASRFWPARGFRPTFVRMYRSIP
jgi:ribosomal protein S18 acetylase RimI-like enzyme